MKNYLYTITCCGCEIDIFSNRLSRCPCCNSTFEVTSPTSLTTTKGSCANHDLRKDS